MKNRRMIAALLAAVMCAILLGACSSGSSEDNSEPQAGSSAAGAPVSDVNEGGVSSGSVEGIPLGEFSTQDIEGNAYTQDIFKDYDLTMVNVFATWCTPCVAEMPDLEKLHQQVADQGVNVVGVVLDVLDETGEIVQENQERAKELVEKTGVTYTVLLPDSTYLNGRLLGIDAIPETFFVDKNGNIVGETYTGSDSLEGWLEVVEKELKNVQGAQ